MTDYRRNFVPGGSYFFTVALANRKRRLLIEHIDLLKAAMQTVKRELPFHIVAMVVLPEHLHCVWSLSEGDADYSTRWKKIKARFSRGLPKHEPRSVSRVDKGERGIWQRRYWEHTLRDEVDLRRHVDYIHFNPVKHGHVNRVVDWPYSTFHRYVQQGVYPRDWGGGIQPQGDFGE